MINVVNGKMFQLSNCVSREDLLLPFRARPTSRAAGEAFFFFSCRLVIPFPGSGFGAAITGVGRGQQLPLLLRGDLWL